jgi:hypothetical protein
MQTYTSARIGSELVIPSQKIRYCLYARKSTESDEKQALSIESQIKEMSKTLKQFPNDLKRVKKIHNILKNNGLPYHIFIDSEKFIMEGRCRIVSQYLSKR